MHALILHVLSWSVLGFAPVGSFASVCVECWSLSSWDLGFVSAEFEVEWRVVVCPLGGDGDGGLSGGHCSHACPRSLSLPRSRVWFL